MAYGNPSGRKNLLLWKKKRMFGCVLFGTRLADLTEGKLEIFFEKLEEGNAEYEKYGMNIWII